jgi:hypothetical protein
MAHLESRLPIQLQGVIKTAHTNKSPFEGMDEFISFVKMKKSAMKQFRDILRNDHEDLAVLLESGIDPVARTNTSK